MQHIDAGLGHHWRAAHVKLAVLWGLVILQVVLIENIVNKARSASPVVLWEGVR